MKKITNIKFALLAIFAGLFLTASMQAQPGVPDSFDPNASNIVNAIAVQADGKILIGGQFTTLTPNGGAAVTRNFIARLNAVFAPTAAAVSISGRVTDGKRGLSNAVVHLTDQNGNIKTARTSSFGYYQFDDVEAGQTLIFNVYHRRYQFDPQVVTVNDSLTNLNFTAQ